VLVTHAPASGAGAGQSAPAGQGEAWVGHEVCVWAKHTIPAAQSLSTLQGPGRHSLVTIGVQAGGAGQGWLGAQSMAGQAVVPAG
jgi:hypothetical protein